MKKMLKRVSLFAVAVMVLTGSLLVGTMAKYSSTFSGSGSVTVAKWAFNVSGTEYANKESLTNKFTVDLEPTTIDGVQEGVAAPGTYGSFSIEVTNNGEVDAEIGFTFTAVEGGPALKFAYSNETGDVTTEANGNFTFAEGVGIAGNSGTYTYLFGTRTATETTKRVDAGATETITVYWFWDFEGENDTADTDFGWGANEEGYTSTDIVEITVSATQAKPGSAA